MPSRGFRVSRCAECRLASELCVCGATPRLTASTRVLIVAHEKELGKPSGTSRHVARALPGTRVVGREALVAPDLAAGALVLCPSDDAVPLDRAVHGGAALLVVPDGTFRQAGRIARRHPLLARVPRVRLPDGVRALARMRREPRADHVSTLEAVARALGILESAELEARLLALLAEVERRTLVARGLYPRGALAHAPSSKTAVAS